MIGVTGISFASFANVGRMPPSFAKMKLGRKMTYGIPAAFTSCSIAHFAPKYGTRSFVSSVVPSALMSTNRPTPASRAAARRLLRAVDHHALELLRLSLADGDEVDDRVAPGDRGVQGLRPRQVSLDELATQRLEPLRLRRGRGRGSGRPGRPPRNAWTTWPPTKPLPPVTRITAKFL